MRIVTRRLTPLNVPFVFVGGAAISVLVDRPDLGTHDELITSCDAYRPKTKSESATQFPQHWKAQTGHDSTP